MTTKIEPFFLKQAVIKESGNCMCNSGPWKPDEYCSQWEKREEGEQEPTK